MQHGASPNYVGSGPLEFTGPPPLRDQLCADPGSRGAPTPNRHAKGRLQHDQRRRPKKGRPHARSAVPAVPTLAAGGNHHHHPSWHAMVNVKSESNLIKMLDVESNEIQADQRPAAAQAAKQPRTNAVECRVSLLPALSP